MTPWVVTIVAGLAAGILAELLVRRRRQRRARLTVRQRRLLRELENHR